MFAVDDNRLAPPFNLDTLEVTGGSVPLVEGLVRSGAVGAANCGVSEDVSLVYLSASLEGQSRLMRWVDREGNEKAIEAAARGYFYPRISPNGEWVALNVREPDHNDIVVWDFVRETLTLLTLTQNLQQYPVWAADGEHIAYGTSSGVVWKSADGSGVEEPILENPEAGVPYFFSASGTELVFRATDVTGSTGIGMISLEDGSTDIEWLLESQFSERNAELSPDGYWMAYESDQSGQMEIYVRPMPDVNEGRYKCRMRVQYIRSGRRTEKSCSISSQGHRHE